MMKYDIFVSYRRTDRRLAEELVARLRERNVSVWIDSHIEGGADWRETIVEALTNADMLVILFTDECNDSRQLKKELAIADDMQKPVVPILLEDARPRGAYLYELADRNWIQAWPDPASHFDRLLEHLVLLCQKTSDGLSGSTGPSESPPAPQSPSPEAAPSPPPAVPTPAAHTAPDAPVSYVGKKGAAGKKLNDILPFRWIDLVVLLPALCVAFAVAMYALDPALLTNFFAEDFYWGITPDALTIFAMIVAGYGAMVFPVRYFLRGRPLGVAMGKYAISSLILLALFFAASLTAGFAWYSGIIIAVIVWIGFAILAFAAYGAMAARRAMTRFRANLKTV